eukprot:TRINITY_DN99_c0_g2_i3.p1 TRINITY_DN99_c0_g2~~TRINITY_DN99_c0_g2_i3.p1  ORF type:complete len:237 (+),score=63.79 TRINITY_DN99_c0_g2_i3:77-787(+)
MSYDKAITVFSPNGQLLQVEYAMEAVNKGYCCVAVRGKDCIALGIEKATVSKLQDSRTLQKVLLIDENTCIAFAGLNADARILANMARVEAQSYRLSYEDAPTVDYIARYISSCQQKFTQKGGARPFGLSNFICGFDQLSRPRLFQTEPSGFCTEWKANAIGRNSKQVREFLEKNFAPDLNREDTLRLVTRALLESVEANTKNVDIAIISTEDRRVQFLGESDLQKAIDYVISLKK